MKTLKILLFSFLAVFLSAGCASVKFYSKPDLSGETGLRYYTVKPYLLVELNSEKDNTVKTTLLWLPDLSNPQYIVLKPGIGSNELKLAFTNSSLTSYGLVSESEIPETIGDLSTLISKTSDAVQPFAKPQEDPKQTQSDNNFKLFEIIINSSGTTLKEINTQK